MGKKRGDVCWEEIGWGRGNKRGHSSGGKRSSWQGGGENSAGHEEWVPRGGPLEGGHAVQNNEEGKKGGESFQTKNTDKTKHGEGTWNHSEKDLGGDQSVHKGRLKKPWWGGGKAPTQKGEEILLEDTKGKNPIGGEGKTAKPCREARPVKKTARSMETKPEASL